MPRRFFTVEDIRRLAREKTKTLVLREGDVLTHEAADLAYALDLKVVHQAESTVGVETKAAATSPPLRVVHLANVQVQPFLEPVTTPGTNAWVKNVLGPEDRSPMDVRYLSFDKGEMKRTILRDEVDIVLEGELAVERGNERVHAKVGDVIHISKGSNITMGTPHWARLVCVTWNEK